MLTKGSILKAWGKKQAVALNTSFFKTFPELDTVNSEDADIAWLLYDLKLNETTNRFQLVLNDIVYTEFESALETITILEPGDMKDFTKLLKKKLDKELHSHPPDEPLLTDFSLS